MEEFRNRSLTGEWWDTEVPDARYRGVLLLEDTNHGKLTLRATEEEFASLRSGPFPRTFHGVMQNSYNYSVTLFDAYRLKHLFSLYPKSCSPLFLGGDSDMRMLKEIRNFLTHYGDQKKFDKDFLWSAELHGWKEKTRLFLEICLLGSIGMEDDNIYALMEDFGPYRQWRLQASMEFANAMLAQKISAANTGEIK